MKPLAQILTDHRIPAYSLDDSTLSSGEYAHAVVVAALIDSWDGLDGRQQRAIVNVLEESTLATEEAEGWARNRRPGL